MHSRLFSSSKRAASSWLRSITGRNDENHDVLFSSMKRATMTTSYKMKKDYRIIGANEAITEHNENHPITHPMASFHP
jgi:hypothetical protein